MLAGLLLGAPALARRRLAGAAAAGEALGAFGGELRAFDWLIPIVLSVAFIAPGIAARNRRGRRRRAAAPPIG